MCHEILINESTDQILFSIFIDFFKSLTIFFILLFYFHSMKTGHRFYLHPGCTSLLTFNGEHGGSARLTVRLDDLKGVFQPH